MRRIATLPHRRFTTLPTKSLTQVVVVRSTLVAGAALLVLTGGCSIQHRPKRQFAGKLLSQDPACSPTQGTLVAQNDQIIFSPADTTWTLTGTLVGDRLELTRSRPSFDHKLYATALKATLSNDRVTGTYSTPTCTYAVDLKQF